MSASVVRKKEYAAIVDPTPIEFPAIFFKAPIYLVHERRSDLYESTAAALSNKFFIDARIVDARGRVQRVRDARKVRGIGPLRGWNLFFNQRIEIQLDLELEQEQVQLEQLKRWIRESWARWSGWSAGGDLRERRAALARATTLAEVFEAVRERFERLPER